MSGRSRLFTAALALALALGPALAEAKPGGSMGSRGTRTYNSTPAQPIERSVTPPAPQGPAIQNPAGAPTRAPYGQPGMAQPGMGARNPFLTGLAGGLLGVGLGHMLFGGHAADYQSGGAGGVLGTILRFLLIAGVAFAAWTLIRRLMAPRAPAAAAAAGYAPPPVTAYRGVGGPGFDAAPPGAGHAPPAAPASAVEVAMQQDDLARFEAILTGVMAAWSRADIAGLRRLVTPEMLSYLSEELTGNQSRGVHNRVEDVVLANGDVVESWQENGATYCTAVLRWTARDWTVAEEDGRVVGGDPERATETGEAWTFVRAGGGIWLLSAIQQL